MKNINQALESMLSQVNKLSVSDMDNALDNSWKGLSDKSKIEDIIELDKSNGVCKKDVVDTANIMDNGVTYSKLSDGGIDFSLVSNNPSGSSTTDTYKENSRIFTTRGSRVINLINHRKEAVTGASTTSGDFYNMIDGNAVLNNYRGVSVPLDILYDETLRIPRFQTLRFDYLLNVRSTVGQTIQYIYVDLKLAYYKRSDNSINIGSLLLPNTDTYYDATYTIKTKASFAFTTGTGGQYWWIAGELDLNQNNLLSSILEDFWGTYTVDNFSDSSLVDVGEYNRMKYSLLNSQGVIRIIPEMAVISSGSSLVKEWSVLTQHYSVVNKVLDNEGWVVSERSYYI